MTLVKFFRTNILTILFFLTVAVNGYAQKVFIANSVYEADVKVYVTGFDEQADLSVFWVGFSHESGDNNGLWFDTPHQRFAQYRIYYAERKSEADITIRFVDSRLKAGWNNKRKSHYFK